MKYATQRCYGIVVAMAGCLGGFACESQELSDPSEVVSSTPPASGENHLNTPAPPISDAQRAELAREDAKIRCHESVSSRELSVRWEKTSEAPRSELTAFVKNNGTAMVTADPVLLAANTSLGESREQRLAPVTVEPGAETALTVSVADFPVQSVGESTSVSIGLRWSRSGVQAEMVTPQAISQPVFVTHDDESFRTAVLRDHDAELARELAGVARAKPALRRLRRAIAVTDTKRFEMLERPDAPTVAVSTLDDAPSIEIDRRQP